ncbi:signal transduction histidine kinase [Phytomonospora endophytica]|uniref:histidine kinase n=2 Tax=Phytomonospora endophytica TaxID=714109 RepID=A0A841F5M2_9ACTN|nr:signal transduction histidine kinase [Phytomonospora endophytica]GIG68560.1 sensor protein CutS [Phytomonospora endophytica]
MNRLTGRLRIRTRLTLVYGGLFMLAGIVLLALTYVLVAQRIPAGGVENNISGSQEQNGEPGLLVTHMSEVVEDAQRDTARELITQGAVALAVVGAVAIALGWLLAARLLRPLHRVTETARRIADAPAAGRGLHERIALGGPRDEVRELADTFDVMLERLDASFDGQRRFIANASHELRTPLTLNRALIEVAVHRGPASDEVRHLGETLLAVNARHERLIEGLLLLADSERELTERSFVDLADVVEHVAGQEPAGSVVVKAVAGEAPTTGDPVLLERLVQNLVENGVRYNVDGGWVRVASRTAPDGSAVVEVSNTGPVVPRYEVGSLFEPFRRLGAERLSATSPGAGLGLSIVRAVARAHGGEVRAEPRDGGGLVVTVTLPEG